MKKPSRRLVVLSALAALPGLAKDRKKSRKKEGPLGLLSGTVFHSSGLSFPGATVTVFDADDKARWKATTDRRGEYAFRVPATVDGVAYRLTAAAKGFQTAERELVAYEAQRSSANFRLRPEE